ncbi:MAG: tetratricopeptide repeat protein [Bdellovibrionaceae bacterium]|nr:tetratricopeptide repeat protein [Pseudobdellovibrionaceae bacterium]
MLMTWIFVFSTLLAAPLAGAQGPSFDNHFQAGLKAYQTKVYEEAEAHFKKALEVDPRNAAAMIDLGLTYSQLSKPGHAIAWFRRTLAVDPSSAEARAALEYSLSKLEIKEIPHRIEMFETIRSHFLQRFSLVHFLGLGLILLLAAGWGLLSWLGARRRANKGEADEAPPAFPWTTGLLLVLFLLNTTGTALKMIDLSEPRGTVVAVKVEALSAPGADGVSLFELHQGFEVLVGELRDGWVQVTYPGGLTGWIPQADLIPLGGGF